MAGGEERCRPMIFSPRNTSENFNRKSPDSEAASHRGQVARASSSGHRARRCRAETSLRRQRHLSGHEQVDLSPVVFIVGKALIDLRSGELREAVCPQRVNGFAILKQADNIVDGNPGTFHRGVPTAHARRANDVAICLRDRSHTWMVRLASQCVNRTFETLDQRSRVTATSVARPSTTWDWATIAPAARSKCFAGSACLARMWRSSVTARSVLSVPRSGNPAGGKIAGRTW